MYNLTLYTLSPSLIKNNYLDLMNLSWFILIFRSMVLVGSYSLTSIEKQLDSQPTIQYWLYRHIHHPTRMPLHIMASLINIPSNQRQITCLHHTPCSVLNHLLSITFIITFMFYFHHGNKWKFHHLHTLSTVINLRLCIDTKHSIIRAYSLYHKVY